MQIGCDWETIIYYFLPFQSYFDFMDESETIPLRLRGKRDVVFGNLKEIYKFHDT